MKKILALALALCMTLSMGVMSVSAEEEQTTLKLYWSMQVIRDGEKVMKHLLEELL